MQDIGFFASVEDVGNHSIRLGIVGRRCPESLLLAMTAADEAVGDVFVPGLKL